MQIAAERRQCADSKHIIQSGLGAYVGLAGFRFSADIGVQGRFRRSQVSAIPEQGSKANWCAAQPKRGSTLPAKFPNRDSIPSFVAQDPGLPAKIVQADFGGLSFIGGASFASGGSAEMVFDNKTLSIDINGDAVADAAIELRYVNSLTVEGLLL